MRKAKPLEVWIGGAAALALACAAVITRTGMFGIAPDGKHSVHASASTPSAAGAHHP